MISKKWMAGLLAAVFISGGSGLVAFGQDEAAPAAPAAAAPAAAPAGGMELAKEAQEAAAKARAVLHDALRED